MALLLLWPSSPDIKKDLKHSKKFVETNQSRSDMSTQNRYQPPAEKKSVSIPRAPTQTVSAKHRSTRNKYKREGRESFEAYPPQHHIPPGRPRNPEEHSLVVKSVAWRALARMQWACTVDCLLPSENVSGVYLVVSQQYRNQTHHQEPQLAQADNQ